MTAKAATTQHRCVTASLADPHLGGLLLGLDLKDGLATLNPAMFPCCNGEGSYFDEKSNTVFACKLKKRIARVQDILDQYHAQWGGRKGAPPFRMSTRSSIPILEAAHALLGNDAPRAIILKGEKDKPGIIWAHALALTYRFDLDIRLVHFKRDCTMALWNNPSPAVLLIEHVDRLWDPDWAMELDSLLTFAYQGAMPCLIEFMTQGHPLSLSAAPPPPGESIMLDAQMRRRIDLLKQRSPMTFVTASTLSMLKEMTAGNGSGTQTDNGG